MRRLFILPLLITLSTAGQNPIYKVRVTEDKNVSVQAVFSLLNDTIFIFARGTTAELPEGEAGFVQNLVVKDKE